MPSQGNASADWATCMYWWAAPATIRDLIDQESTALPIKLGVREPRRLRSSCGWIKSLLPIQSAERSGSIRPPAFLRVGHVGLRCWSSCTVTICRLWPSCVYRSYCGSGFKRTCIPLCIPDEEAVAQCRVQFFLNVHDVKTVRSLKIAFANFRRISATPRAHAGAAELMTRIMRACPTCAARTLSRSMVFLAITWAVSALLPCWRRVFRPAAG
jgi:hypothetical protein